MHKYEMVGQSVCIWGEVCVACTVLLARRSCMFVTLKDATRSMARRHIFEHIFGKITSLCVAISTLKI